MALRLQIRHCLALYGLLRSALERQRQETSAAMCNGQPLSRLPAPPTRPCLPGGGPAHGTGSTERPQACPPRSRSVTPRMESRDTPGTRRSRRSSRIDEVDREIRLRSRSERPMSRPVRPGPAPAACAVRPVFQEHRAPSCSGSPGDARAAAEPGPRWVAPAGETGLQQRPEPCGRSFVRPVEDDPIHAVLADRFDGPLQVVRERHAAARHYQEPIGQPESQRTV